MAIKSHRATRTARTRSRKFSGHCEACGKPLCSCRVYQYTDESNGAITASAPFLCRSCYEQHYGVKIPTETEQYKARLLDKLGGYLDAFPDERERDLLFRIMRLIDSAN